MTLLIFTIVLVFLTLLLSLATAAGSAGVHHDKWSFLAALLAALGLGALGAATLTNSFPCNGQQN